MHEKHGRARAPVASADTWICRLSRSNRCGAIALLEELFRLSERHERFHSGRREAAGLPFRISTDVGLLSFFSMTTVFGTPMDITLAELALEFFFPLDAATVERAKRL
jgi:MmyB-like transcription regulator ligand binding domain